jgi:hypothetical protein
VVKSPEGRDGAASTTNQSNNPDAVLTAWATRLAGSILTGTNQKGGEHGLRCESKRQTPHAMFSRQSEAAFESRESSGHDQDTVRDQVAERQQRVCSAGSTWRG